MFQFRVEFSMRNKSKRFWIGGYDRLFMVLLPICDAIEPKTHALSAWVSQGKQESPLSRPKAVIRNLEILESISIGISIHYGTNGWLSKPRIDRNAFLNIGFRV